MAAIDQRDDTGASSSTAASATTTATTTGSPTENGVASTATSSLSAGARINHCSFISNSTLYVFGGQSASSSTASGALPLFASLDLNSQFSNSSKPSAWETLPSANAVPVLNPQCISTGTHLLVVGGQPLNTAALFPTAKDGSGVFCGLQAYSFEDQVWQILMPQITNEAYINLNRTGHVAEYFQDIGNGNPGLFVMGGLHYNASQPANDAFMLSPFTIPAPGGQAIIGSTSIPNNLPPPTMNSGSALTNGGTSVLFFGGKAQTGDEPTTIWEYTPKTSAWKTLSVSLPQPMPNAKKGWVTAQNSLVAIDLTTNTGNDFSNVPLANSGLRSRQTSTGSSAPSPMDGYSVAFDTTRNIAIVSGGDSADPRNLEVFNPTSNTWSVLSFERDVSLSVTSSASPSLTTTSTATPTATSAAAAITTSAHHQSNDSDSPDSTGFNKKNLLAPIILGSILGLLGLIGIILLICSYRRRKSKQNRQSSRKSGAPGGLWLKYGNNKDSPRTGEIFLRNLEEKHGIKRSQSGAQRTGWSKYFSASWYLTSNPPRASTSTSNTARALVTETRGQTAAGGGWDVESRYSQDSRYSKASSFFSTEEAGEQRDTFSGIRWSFIQPRGSRASSGVLGATLGTQGTGFIGAGGVNKL